MVLFTPVGSVCSPALRLAKGLWRPPRPPPARCGAGRGRGSDSGRTAPAGISGVIWRGRADPDPGPSLPRVRSARPSCGVLCWKPGRAALASWAGEAGEAGFPSRCWRVRPSAGPTPSPRDMYSIRPGRGPMLAPALSGPAPPRVSPSRQPLQRRATSRCFALRPAPRVA